MNIVVNNLDMKKVDFKEFEKLSTTVSKKTDNEILSNSLIQIKNDIYDSFTHYRNEFEHNKKIFEENISEKVNFTEKNLEKTLEDFNKNKGIKSFLFSIFFITIFKFKISNLHFSFFQLNKITLRGSASRNLLRFSQILLNFI